MPDRKKKLFDILSSKGLYSKTYDDFNSQFSDPDKIGKLYQALQAKGLYTKNIENFNSQFFSDIKKKTSGNDYSNMPEISTQPSPPFADVGEAENRAKSKIVDNPILGKYFNNDNLDIVMASPDRIAKSKQYGGNGLLEFWPSDETGSPEFPSPKKGKNVIEIYSDELKNNPDKLTSSAFRDALHILPRKDAQWRQLRNELIKATPQQYFDNWRKNTGDKRSLKDFIDKTGADGLIRGAFDEDSEFGASFRKEPTYIYNGKKYKSEPIYSIKQREILNKMREYIGSDRPSNDKMSSMTSKNVLPESNLGLNGVHEMGIGSSLTRNATVNDIVKHAITGDASQQELSESLNNAMSIYDAAHTENASAKIQAQAAEEGQSVIDIEGAHEGVLGAISNYSKYLGNKFLEGAGSVSAGAGDLIAQGIMAVMPEVAGPNGSQDRESALANFRKQVSPATRAGLRETIGYDQSEQAEQRFNDGTITGAIGGLASSVPAMLTPYQAGLYLQGYDSALQSVADKDIDEDTKTIYGSTVGAVTGLLEKIGYDRVFKTATPGIAKAIANSAIKEASEETGGKITGDILTNFLNKKVSELTGKFGKVGMKAFDSFATEALTGASQEGATIGAEAILNKAEGKSVFDTSNLKSWEDYAKRIGYAGLQEGIGGLAMFGGMSLLNRGRKAKVESLQASLDEIDNSLENPDVTDETKEVILQQKVALQENLNKELKAEQKDQEKIPSNKIIEAETLNEQIDKFYAALNDENISEPIKEGIKNQISELEKQIDEITSVKETPEETLEAVTENKSPEIPVQEVASELPGNESVSIEIQPNDIVNYTDENGNVIQAPVESLSDDTATIGINQDGIYKSVEVPIEQVTKIDAPVIQNIEQNEQNNQDTVSEDEIQQVSSEEEEILDSKNVNENVPSVEQNAFNSMKNDFKGIEYDDIKDVLSRFNKEPYLKTVGELQSIISQKNDNLPIASLVTKLLDKIQSDQFAENPASDIADSEIITEAPISKEGANLESEEINRIDSMYKQVEDDMKERPQLYAEKAEAIDKKLKAAKRLKEIREGMQDVEKELGDLAKNGDDEVVQLSIDLGKDWADIAYKDISVIDKYISDETDSYKMNTVEGLSELKQKEIDALKPEETKSGIKPKTIKQLDEDKSTVPKVPKNKVDRNNEESLNKHQGEIYQLKEGDNVSFIDHLGQPETGKILEAKSDGMYSVLKSNGVKNNIESGKLSKINNDNIIKENSQEQQRINDQSGDQDAKLMANSFMSPVINAIKQGMGAINKFQERYIAENSRKVEDWIANELNTWTNSKNWFKRNASQIFTSIMNGIPRTQKNINGKLQLAGGFSKARNDASKLLKNLYAIVGDNPESLERIHQVIDPEIYKAKEVDTIEYDDLSKEEQILYDQLRKMLDDIHRRNFALGFIDQATYDKFKGKYSPRMYETFEIPDDVQKLIDEQEKYHPVTKLDLGQFKARKEVEDLSQEAKDALLKDPVYGAVKRLMQLDQNASIANYINQIINDSPQLIKDPAKDVIQDGYKLMSGKGYGKLDGKYVPNYIAEDFKGFYMINDTLNKMYDWFKAYDRFTPRQFLKKSYTVFNPVVQLGNFISNFTFAFASGIDPVTFTSGLPEAYKALKKKGADYDTLLENGILGSDIVTADLLPLKAKSGLKAKKQPLLIKAWNKFDEQTSKVYAMSDEIAKMNAYLIFKDQGFTENQALQKVYEGFQNYATVGKMWDAASKTPVIGNPFLKFQADLFRIIKNGITKTPLTTAMYLASLYSIPKIFALTGLSDGEEDDKEEELRTSRKFIPKVPLGFTDMPLVYKTKFGEVNLARYLSPFYLFDTSDDDGVENLARKVSPFTMLDKEQAGKGNDKTVVGLSDPLAGTLLSALVTDTDFRGKSIKDPEATRFRASGVTAGEELENKLTFLARSWVPQGSQIHDFYLSQKYGEDFYGRTRDLSQSLMNMVIKVQDWKEGDYKKEAQKRLDVNLSRLKSLSDERNNIIKNLTTKAEDAYQDFNESKISKVQRDRRIDDFKESLLKRLKKNEDEQIDTYKKTEEFVEKYKGFL